MKVQNIDKNFLHIHSNYIFSKYYHTHKTKLHVHYVFGENNQKKSSNHMNLKTKHNNIHQQFHLLSPY